MFMMTDYDLFKLGVFAQHANSAYTYDAYAHLTNLHTDADGLNSVQDGFPIDNAGHGSYSGTADTTTWYAYDCDVRYYGYRYYSPSLGRWLSRDPIGDRGALGIQMQLTSEFSGLESDADSDMKFLEDIEMVVRDIMVKLAYGTQMDTEMNDDQYLRLISRSPYDFVNNAPVIGLDRLGLVAWSQSGCSEDSCKGSCKITQESLWDKQELAGTCSWEHDELIPLVPKPGCLCACCSGLTYERRPRKIIHGRMCYKAFYVCVVCGRTRMQKKSYNGPDGEWFCPPLSPQ